MKIEITKKCIIDPVNFYMLINTNKFFYKFVLFLICECSYLFSQEVSSDSIKTYNSKEVVVTATRSEILIKNSPSYINILAYDELGTINGDKLSDKIINSPGLIIKDYGQNNLKSISMRGLGSEHTLFLLDGEKLNSYQNGIFDLNNLIIEDVERIELLRGGNSAFYGSDAIGGVVNIIPKHIFQDFGIKTNLSLGSFENFKYYVGFEGKIKDFGIQTSIVNERSKNNYQYSFNDGFDTYKGVRDNSDVLSRQISIHANQYFQNSTSLDFYCKYFYSDKGVPDIVTALTSKARQKDFDLISFINYKSKLNENNELSITPKFHYSKLLYNDPRFNSSKDNLDNESNIYNYGLNSQLKQVLGTSFGLISGLEIGRTEALSNNYSGRKSRSQFASYMAGDITISDYIIPLILLYPAIRYDYYSDFGGQISPKIGLNIHLFKENLLFRSSYSKNYRAPTFNDLYWNPGGNQDLKAEHSTGFDFGFGGYFNFLGRHSLEIDYFNIDMKDRIIWLPYSGMIWRPKNVQDVNSNGLEVSLQSKMFNDMIYFNLSYNYINSRNISKSDNNYNKFIPYIPNHIIKWSVAFNLTSFNFGLAYNYNGDRYSTESNERMDLLSEYDFMNAYTSFSIKIYQIDFVTRLELNNILNSEYVVMPYYPTALRNYKLSISIKY